MPTIDTERYRLRNFVQGLVDCGECEVREEPIDLVDVAAALDGKDGREIVRELDALYAARRLGRLDDGRYVLKDSK